MSDENDPMLKPDGHRYEAPESKDSRVNKEVAYVVLGLLVVVLAILIATGTVPIYPG
jgi:hypothetical protein